MSEDSKTIIIHDEDEERREYHRSKTASQRENWKTLGCAQVSHHVPESWKVYMRGQVACMNAIHCLNLIREGDEEAMLVMSNTRPRYDVKHVDIDVFAGRSDTIDERCEFMVKLLREARWHRAEGNSSGGIPVLNNFHFSMEWCIVTYLKGYYDITMHMIKFGDTDISLKFDVFDMRGAAPSVL